MTTTIRIGIDLGGTKIASIALAPDGSVLAEMREPARRNDYEATLSSIVSLTERTEAKAGQRGSVGIAIPGSLSPVTGLMQNANSTWLNGRKLDKDIEHRLGRPVRIANDANCFALSEATDGAGKDHATVFGVILGTGCGGGVVIDGRIVDGSRGTGGEWGHNPLPWARHDETPGPECWCGRRGCMERWVSGPALAADHQRVTGEDVEAQDVYAAAKAGNGDAMASLDRHADRLARGLAAVANIIDPDVIVLGGGLSEMEHLYQQLPELMAPHIFADSGEVLILPPQYGSASGVRGAAWLWNAQ